MTSSRSVPISVSVAALTACALAGPTVCWDSPRMIVGPRPAASRIGRAGSADARSGPPSAHAPVPMITAARNHASLHRSRPTMSPGLSVSAESKALFRWCRVGHGSASLPRGCVVSGSEPSRRWGYAAPCTSHPRQAPPTEAPLARLRGLVRRGASTRWWRGEGRDAPAAGWLAGQQRPPRAHESRIDGVSKRINK